tara:strand:- start:2 stop:2374 length:2373 start_codon:yes stop_codon:yes gene_type:complete
MSSSEPSDPDPKETSGGVLGLTKKRRYKIYAWGALVLLLSAVVLTGLYLRPDRWYTYTDQVAFEQVAQDVKPGYVVWDPAQVVTELIGAKDMIGQPAISSDGARMVYAVKNGEDNSNIFLRIWDGVNWQEPRPMRALNSQFNETTPTLSGNGELLFFTSDRPGGQGGKDIWVSKWDGVEYAWPLPLTARINTPFDETDPDLSPDNMTLFFVSNRPHQGVGISEKEAAEAAAAEQLADVSQQKVDYEIYSADIATETAFDLIIERQLSMLYSLREGALADKDVMSKLGGSESSESAVEKALTYLANLQEEDGRWDIGKSGGQAGHDIAATAFSLLAFYGRGERHDKECKYQKNVRLGLEWMLNQQIESSGDLRGNSPQNNAMYDHGIAALALVEAYGVTKDSKLKPKAQAAIDFIVESQHEEGGWRYRPKERGDLSVTGWMVMALASAKMSGLAIPQSTFDGVDNFLEIISGGKDGGSYGYTDSPGKGKSGRMAMNAAGFFCAQLSGASSNAAKAFESALIIDNAGFQLNDIYYVYYGTLAAYQHQGPVWRKWLEKMQTEFLNSQEPDGSWPVGGGHGGQMGKVIVTALVALCLEAHYRYTPLYGLGFEPDPEGPNPNVLDSKSLPKDPIFRHAKHLKEFSSPSDEMAPVITDHGDFIYFTSSREGGFGGSDIYRSRISGEVPSAPANLGVEINSKFNETDPAVRMAGFHLLFNSDRDQSISSLYGAKSKRVMINYDYSKMPSVEWIKNNLILLSSAFLVLILFIVLFIRAFKRVPVVSDNNDEAKKVGAN